MVKLVAVCRMLPNKNIRRDHYYEVVKSIGGDEDAVLTNNIKRLLGADAAPGQGTAEYSQY